MKEVYPYRKVLEENECKFYYDEAYDDGDDHENANGCDMCLHPAEYMTCTNGDNSEDDESEYYICKSCVKKFGIESLVDAEVTDDYTKGAYLFEITFRDEVRANSEHEVYKKFLNYLKDVVNYEDVSAFQFFKLKEK